MSGSVEGITSAVAEVLLEELTALIKRQRALLDKLKNGNLYFVTMAVVRESIPTLAGARQELLEELRGAVGNVSAILKQIDREELYEGSIRKPGRALRRLRMANKLGRAREALDEALRHIGKANDVGRMLKEYGAASKARIDDEDAVMFWEQFFGTEAEECSHVQFWAACDEDFVEAMDENRKAFLNKWLLDDANKVTRANFAAAVAEFSFPFEVEESSMRVQPRDLSVTDRIAVASQVRDVIKDYEENVANHVRFLMRDAMKDCKTDEALAERASTYFSANGINERVDDARRKWNHFYTGFSAFWQIIDFSSEAFTAFDFPGKSRVRQFIRYCEVLDEANYRQVICGSNAERATEWDRHRPTVYDFFREWLRRRGDHPNKIPTPVLWGGRRTVQMSLG